MHGEEGPDRLRPKLLNGNEQVIEFLESGAKNLALGFSAEKRQGEMLLPQGGISMTRRTAKENGKGALSGGACAHIPPFAGHPLARNGIDQGGVDSWHQCGQRRAGPSRAAAIFRPRSAKR